MLSLRDNRIKRILSIAGIIVVIFLFVGIALRQSLLNYGFEVVKSKLVAKGFYLEVHSLNFKGVSSVDVTGLTINHNRKKKIMYCDSLRVSLNPISGLFGYGWVNNLQIGSLGVNWSDTISLSSGKKKETGERQDLSVVMRDPLATVKSLLNEVPDRVRISKFNLKYNTGSKNQYFQLNRIIWENELLQGQIQLNQNGKSQVFSVNGKLNKASLFGELEFEGLDKKMVVIQVMDGRFGFSKLKMAIEQVKSDDTGIRIDSKCAITNLLVMHPRISDTTVFINYVSGAPSFQYKNQNLSIDSNSYWKINDFEFFAGAQYPMFDSTGEFWAFLKFNEASGANMFQSLPVGLFRYTSGIRTKGGFSHRFFVWYTPKNLTRTQLEADVFYSPDFEVIKWGKANPNRINGSFHHDYFDRDRWEAGFQVGPENPSYTPFNQISPNLIQSTLRSEDPSFYGHKGFYLEAFREALIANLKEKRFARGGSTISMQLVKNVFLRQHKTLTRKLEEIILVWLIEHERTVSKQRMLEVYYNIIEWGPGIFGVGAASQFYFGKHPSNLNMGESCYLSSLIPAPSKAIWSVDSTGSVSPRWSRYFKIKNRMIQLDSNRFTEEDFIVKIRAFQKP